MDPGIECQRVGQPEAGPKRLSAWTSETTEHLGTRGIYVTVFFIASESKRYAAT